MGERFPAAELAAANAAFVMMYEVGSFGGPIVVRRRHGQWPLYGLPIVVAVAAGALVCLRAAAQSRAASRRRAAARICWAVPRSSWPPPPDLNSVISSSRAGRGVRRARAGRCR